MEASSAGLIWIGEGKGGGFRYFKRFRKMKKHKGQERFEVFVKGRMRVFSRNQIKRLPEKTESADYAE